MNERIKSLIERAEYQAKKQSGYEDWEVYVTPDSQVVFEKFAELIVQECLACAQGAGLADDVAVRNGLGFNDGISEAVTHMKQHFGVKE